MGISLRRVTFTCFGVRMVPTPTIISGTCLQMLRIAWVVRTSKKQVGHTKIHGNAATSSAAGVRRVSSMTSIPCHVTEKQQKLQSYTGFKASFKMQDKLWQQAFVYYVMCVQFPQQGRVTSVAGELAITSTYEHKPPARKARAIGTASATVAGANPATTRHLARRAMIDSGKGAGTT